MLRELSDCFISPVTQNVEHHPYRHINSRYLNTSHTNWGTFALFRLSILSGPPKCGLQGSQVSVASRLTRRDRVHYELDKIGGLPLAYQDHRRVTRAYLSTPVAPTTTSPRFSHAQQRA